MTDPSEYVRNGYLNAATLSIEELERLLGELRKTEGVPPYMIDRIEAVLCRCRNDFDNAAQLFLNAFMATHDLRVFEEFFDSYTKVIGKASRQEVENILDILLSILDGLYKGNAGLVEKAKFNTYFGYFVYCLPATLDSKKAITERWLNIIDLENVRAGIIDCLSGPETGLDISLIRFYPYILACAGLEEEVIRMNTIIANRSKTDDFIFDSSRQSADLYADNKVFQQTTEYFCNLLLGSDSFGDVLDIGCGPGRIGAMIGGRCKSLTGIELDNEYADFAENQSAYGNVIRGDAIAELPKLSQTFDYIVSCMVLEYIPATIVVREAAKLLSPGGHLAFAFIPALEEAEGVLGHAFHYERDFYKKIAPDLSVIKCVMEPYNWTGGYYVLLKRNTSE